MTVLRHHRAIIECLEGCASACERCVSSGVENLAAQRCLRACRDTAALCRLMAELLTRESSLTDWLLPLCELACDGCADECESLVASPFGQCARQCRELHTVLDRALLDVQP